MKNYSIYRIILFLVFITISCTKMQSKDDFINIGDYYDPSILMESKPALLGVGDDFLPAISGYYNGIRVFILIDKNGVITHIDVCDNDFSTPEGYSKLTMYSQIKNDDIKKIVKNIYGSTIIYLRSGWKLHFPSKYRDYKQLPPDATPTCIYKGRDEI